MTLLDNTTLGRYEVRSLIGKGGMGEVYLAHDTQLRRQVALKVLLDKYIGNSDHLRRFQQEACAASALNHPNIVTIYEISQADDIRFISMEYIKGQTLRQKLKNHGLSLRKTVNIAIQVAEALSAAHSAGIIHRDIKPENIMIRQDGYVKVLDFGLAKLSDAHYEVQATPEASTITHFDTGQGHVIGTAAYMSPEQLRGQEIDIRTDIWSLGAVLYEMLVVMPPFKGSTTGEVIVSILERAPEPLIATIRNAPQELQDIISKALQKNRDSRYQSASAMIEDLSRFQQLLLLQEAQNTDIGVNTVYHQNAQTHDLGLLQSNDRGASTNENLTEPDEKKVETDETYVKTNSKEKSTVSEQLALSTITQRFWWRKRFSLLLVLVLIGVAGYLAYFFKDRIWSNNSSSKWEFQRRSLPGDAKAAVISPDGKSIASVVEESGKQTIHLLDLATNSDLRIVGPTAKNYQSLAFTPDSNFVYYLEVEVETHSLYRVSKFGDGKSKILSNVNSSVTFSPDGTQMAFTRYKKDPEETMLVIANINGAEERILDAGNTYNYVVSTEHGGGPAWSPNGKTIASLISTDSGYDIALFQVSEGTKRMLGLKDWIIENIIWPNQEGLIVCGRKLPQIRSQIWQLSIRDGSFIRITNDSLIYGMVSSSADGKSLLTFQHEVMKSLWIVTEGNKQQAVKVKSSSDIDSTSIGWTKAGNLFYSLWSNEGIPKIIVSKEGQEENFSFSAGASNDHFITMTPDDAYIIFVSRRSGAQNIWRANVDGSQLVQLTNSPYSDMPTVTPDGLWIIYQSPTSSHNGAWRVSLEGGTPELIVDRNCLFPAVSPNGDLLACYAWEPNDAKSLRIDIYSMKDFSLTNSYRLPPSGITPLENTLKWSPDEKGIGYITSVSGSSNVWVQPLTGGKPYLLTSFDEGKATNFAWSPDGKKVLCARSYETPTASLITQK